MKLLSASRWRSVAPTLAALALGQIAAAIYVFNVNREYSAFVAKAGEPDKIELELTPLSGPTVISGSPVCGALSFGTSWDGKSTTGLWECDGPAVFEYHYNHDETVYILEGRAEVEYLGKKIVLEPGSSVLFVAGTQAIWTIPHRIRKTWLLHDPGSIVKRTRDLIG